MSDMCKTGGNKLTFPVNKIIKGEACTFSADFVTTMGCQLKCVISWKIKAVSQEI